MEAGGRQFCWFLPRLILSPPEVGGDMYLRNVSWLSVDYTVHFKITAMRTLNPFVSSF
jgi:hypothetical protein